MNKEKERRMKKQNGNHIMKNRTCKRKRNEWASPSRTFFMRRILSEPLMGGPIWCQTRACLGSADAFTYIILSQCGSVRQVSWRQGALWFSGGGINQTRSDVENSFECCT
jgi:hypothetical protein